MITSLLAIALSLGADHADTTIRLPRHGAVEIDTRSRDVVIRVGAGDVVVVRGGDAQLDGGTLDVDASERVRGTLDVTVPAFASVEVSSVDGNVTINNMPAHLQVETVSGFVHLNGGTAGWAELESVGGPVVVNGFHGERLSIDATAQDVLVTNSSGRIEVDATNGGVTLRGIQSDRVTASSINKGVTFEGPLLADGAYQFTSQNDNVTLVLPAAVSARMRVATMNGGLRTEIPATTRGRQAGGRGDDNDSERVFDAIFGGGEAHVTVEVFNGSLVVRKQR